MSDVGQEIRRLREARGWSQPKLAVEAGVAVSGISQIENGRRNPNSSTLAKIAKALEMEVRDLFPKASLQLPLNGFVNGVEDEQRAVWEAAADQARRLREDGRARMDELLAAWRASRKRGEPRAERREYMDDMGNLLEEVYAAEVALGEAYIEAAITEGGSEAKVPRYLREESRTTRDFYVELLGLVQSAGLSVRRGDDAAAAKRAEKVQAGRRPHSVEEPKAA
jgi:transcriptional regulator with XRE-family HTH domain